MAWALMIAETTPTAKQSASQPMSAMLELGRESGCVPISFLCFYSLALFSECWMPMYAIGVRSTHLSQEHILNN
jgi:hypothetical protein